MLAGKQVIALERGSMSVKTPAAAQPEQQLEEIERLRGVIGKLGRRLRPTKAGAGLTPSQIAVLFTIVRRGPLGLAALAETESLNPTMLSRIVAELTDKGLIRRTADPQDRRAALVEATPAGARMRERINQERARALAAHLSRLSEDERDRIWEALPVLEELAELMRGDRP
jgi:DNA-binding MarR family transcriptional regulator